MEESEAEAEAKAHSLVRKYQDDFLEITYTIHPMGRPGEIKGKSSNVAWAAREMVRLAGGAHHHEVLTVMDADTCFAQDYFTSISYHYTVAPREQREIMLFAPCTVFDRNSNDVPFLVRVADMSWSAGVMSNLYPSSPIKLPCSAYSLSMQLANAVGYWDTDPQSMGEDMHMYLKCFFATEGRLEVRTIYSPASQCNVQGSTWYKGLLDRYTQAKRHMWGCLDTGYVIRRCIFAILAPGFDATNGTLQRVPLLRPANSRNRQDMQISTSKMLALLHRVLEAHILMGHVFVLVLFTSLTIPTSDAPSWIASSYWSLLTTENVHPYVSLSIWLAGWARVFVAIPFICMLFYYEKYQRWVGKDRWEMADCPQTSSSTSTPQMRKVQPLGRRPHLTTERTMLNLLDWIALPACGLLYLALPQMNVQLQQLWTDKLDYSVASKPAVQGKNHSHATELKTPVTIAIDKVSFDESSSETQSEDSALTKFNPTPRNTNSLSISSSISSLHLYDDIDMKSTGSSRGDSGFFEFDDSTLPSSGPISPSLYSPAMWRSKSIRSFQSLDPANLFNNTTREKNVFPPHQLSKPLDLETSDEISIELQ